jgi:hypothetical protein
MWRQRASAPAAPQPAGHAPTAPQNRGADHTHQCFAALQKLFEYGLPSGGGNIDVTGGHCGGGRYDLSCYGKDGPYQGVFIAACSAEYPDILCGRDGKSHTSQSIR